MPTDGGGKASLSALKGKKVVLYFYPKDDTSGCTAEAIAFNGLRDKFKAAGAVLLGVSPDSAASHDKFKKKHDLKFPLASDEKKSMLEAYGVWQEKSMYGRKYMGVERHDVPDRRRRENRQSLAQGEGARPCRRGARRRQGDLSARPHLRRINPNRL